MGVDERHKTVLIAGAAENVEIAHALRDVRVNARVDQRVVTVDLEATVEACGRRDLSVRGVVLELDVQVTADVVRDLVMRFPVDGETLDRALEEVEGAEVEGLSRAAGERNQGAGIILEEEARASVSRRNVRVDPTEVGGAHAAKAVRARAPDGTSTHVVVRTDLLTLAQILEEQGHVATIIGGVGAKNGGNSRTEAIQRRARNRLLGRAQQTLGKIIVVLIDKETTLNVDFQAFEVVPQNEVHDTGHGIGTINSGRTTGHHIDSLDKLGRD